MAKLALVGYGKMGKAIEQEALKRNHTISYRIDAENVADMANLHPDNTDVVIEFTHPDSFLPNLHQLLPTQIPIVSGTTGWYEQMETVQQLVRQHQAGFLYAANFSVGVNILFKLNQQLAKIMNRYPEYDVFVEEHHHRFKADAPSGTAHALSGQILQELDRKERIATDALLNRPPESEELSVGYIRAGGIPGTHRVTYTSEIDQVSIVHQAFSRGGFALGAVLAAEWMRGKEGFYEFSALFE